MTSIPAFAREEWYLDHRDPRCPHDAWLEAVEISEPAEGSRRERRRTNIKITLLGAFHDGYIVFRYAGVRSYSLASGRCALLADDGPENRVASIQPKRWRKVPDRPLKEHIATQQVMRKRRER